MEWEDKTIWLIIILILNVLQSDLTGRMGSYVVVPSSTREISLLRPTALTETKQKTSLSGWAITT